MNDITEILPEKESGNENRICPQGKTNVAVYAQQYCKRHGNMHGKNPLKRELANICPPIAERQIE